MGEQDPEESNQIRYMGSLQVCVDDRRGRLGQSVFGREH